MLLPYFAPSHPRLYSLYDDFSLVLYTLRTPRLDGVDDIFWKKVAMLACRSMERHLKMGMLACRSIERHAKMPIFKCRSMERHASRATFFQNLSSIASRRGVHKAYNTFGKTFIKKVGNLNSI